MLKLKVTLRALAAAGGIGAVMLAGLPALASSGHVARPAAAKAITGPEVLAGTVRGKAAVAQAPVIPLKLTGLVPGRTNIHLGGSAPKGATKTLKTTAGNLVVKIAGKTQNTQSLNAKTCRETFNDYLPVSVVGSKSTGSFAGASGPGAVAIDFSAIAPRFKSGSKKGQCNPNGQPSPKGAVASFLASLILTAK